MTAAREVTIDGELLAVSRSYRRRLIGTPAIYVTANGAVVRGVIAEHPLSPGGVMLAVTQPDGRWAGIYAGESFIQG
ncbi:MAG: hypothetical protein KDB70_18720 [Mycobacterium sp.]|nr:hypothetical protein [Mycobacterium sp.]